MKQSKYFINRKLIFIALIIASTFIAYYPSLKNGITNWDDNRYITENKYIHSLSPQNVKENFSNYYFGNYHPVTMLSLALDNVAGGGSPFIFHLINILLHVINSLLVFWLVLLILKDFRPALLCALLFGVHTFHVESVAWISERKDLLYTFFYLLSVISYIKYITGNRLKFYFFSLGLFIVSVLSKGMAVTLPVVLMATDFLYKRNPVSIKAIIEKLPFFVISLVLGIIAIYAQKSEYAISETDVYSLYERVFLAFYGFTQYILKLIFPFHLSSFYPYPSDISFVFWIFPLIVIGITAWAFYSLKKSRIWFFGFIFFAVNLMLVLQIFPVGKAIIADRYSYLSSVGFFLILGGFYQQFVIKPQIKTVVIFAAAIYIFTLSVLTYNRCQVWKDSITLWTDVIEKYPDFYLGYSNRGIARAGMLDYKGAITDYNNAIERDKNQETAYFNRGVAMMYFKNFDKAVSDFDKVILLNPPKVAEAYNNRGVSKSELKNYESAITDFTKAIELDSTFSNAYCNRGNALFFTGNYEKSAADFQKALNIDPGNSYVYMKRANTYYYSKKYDAALADLKKATDFNSQYFDAIALKGNILSEMGDLNNAVLEYTKALGINPGSVEITFNRGNTLFRLKEYERAISDFTRVINFNPPRVAEVYYMRGVAEFYLNKLQDACNDFIIAGQNGYPPAQSAIEKYCNGK